VCAFALRGHLGCAVASQRLVQRRTHHHTSATVHHLAIDISTLSENTTLHS
jgi:hypothetical protein